MRIRAMAAASALMALAACAGSEAVRPTPQPTDERTTTAAPRPGPSPATAYPGATWSRAERGDWSALDAGLAANGSTCVAVVLDDSASEEVDEWRTGPALAVTVRDLLSMTSGRRWSEAGDRQMIRATADQTSFAVAADQVRRPGDSWVYDNVAAQALESVLDDLTETGDVVDVANERLLEPLGMRDTVWGRDAVGNALTYSGVESTCLDLARVGHLMLNEGEWERQQRLLTADFVRQATRPSSTLNAAYGLMWWTNAEGRVVETLRQAGFPTDKPPYEGRLASSVPADAYWAFGYGNQYVAVVPSEGIVAVRLGARPASPDRVTFGSFTAGVLDVLGRD